MQKSVFLQYRNYFHKKATLFEKSVFFINTASTRKKVDLVGTTGIFHLIILNSGSGYFVTMYVASKLWVTPYKDGT